MIRYIIRQLQQVVPEEELQTRVLWRTFGVITWISFLFAGLATTLFFATFPPLEIINFTTFSIDLSATAIYTIGFFLFWILCFICTTTSCILLALPLSKRQKQMPE